jgi:hypothetical protein
MKWDIQHMFLSTPITGVTILSVFLSPEFRFIVYFIIVITLVLGTLFFVKKYPLTDAIKKGIIAAFFTSALVYAIYADIGWTKWLVTDVKNYWGLSTEDKLRKMYDGMYEFSMQAKKVINDDYKIYSSYLQEPRLVQYFLLPLNRRANELYMREKASYIVVIKDTEARYDPILRIFTQGETIINNVDLVLMFAQDAYILKRL